MEEGVTRPKERPRWLERGEALFSRGRYKSALRYYRDLLEGTDPLPPDEQKLVKEQLGAFYFRRSQHALSDGKGRKSLELAISRLERAIEYDPESSLYMSELGARRLQLGQVEAADQAFEAAMALGPIPPDHLLDAAIAKLILGDSAGAHELVTEMTAGQKGVEAEGWWRRVHVLALAKSGRLDEAITLAVTPYEGISHGVWLDDLKALVYASKPSDTVLQAVKALAESDGSPWAQELLGDVYFATGAVDKAVSHWLKSVAATSDHRLESKIGSVCEEEALKAFRAGAFPNARSWCERAVHLKACEGPISALLSAVLLAEGVALWRQGDRSRALATWREASARRGSVAASWNQAIAYEEAGDWELAASAWREVDQLTGNTPTPEKLEALKRRGVTGLLMGEIDEAVNAFRRRLDLDPDPDSYAHLGYALLSKGEVRPALSLFQRAVNEVGDDPDLCLGLAICADLSAESAEAKESYWRRAARVSGSKRAKSTWRARAIELGQRLIRANEASRAMRIFADILLDNPSDAEAWIWCGTIHLHQGRPARASACFNKGLAAFANSVDGYIAIGACLIVTNNMTEAQKYLDQAAKSQPSPAGELRMAEVYLQMGQVDLAFDRLRRVVKAGKKGSGELVEAVKMVLASGHAERSLPFLEETLQVTAAPAAMRLLIATQSLRLHQWDHAEGVIKQALADAGDDEALKELGNYFQRALILLMTVGESIQGEFARREKEVVNLWAERERPDADREEAHDQEDAWNAFVQDALTKRIQQRAAGGKIIEADPGSVAPRCQGEKPVFGAPLDISRRLEVRPRRVG